MVFASVVRREPASALPANTVPALVVDRDVVRWFGTIAGLARVQGGQVTPMPFAPGLVLSAAGVGMLETFIHEVAQAVFDARPLTAVQLREDSFLAKLGQPLIKQDFIVSLAEDAQGLWAGTLGGGLRRLEAGYDTLLLTRQEGLTSNLILALAQGPAAPQTL